MHGILVVDDDLGMRTALNEALRRMGYMVDLSHSKRKALDMFREAGHIHKDTWRQAQE